MNAIVYVVIFQHDLNPEESGMPPMIRCMAKSVQQNGVYVIGTVVNYIMYVCHNAFVSLCVCVCMCMCVCLSVCLCVHVCMSVSVCVHIEFGI